MSEIKNDNPDAMSGTDGSPVIEKTPEETIAELEQKARNPEGPGESFEDLNKRQAVAAGMPASEVVDIADAPREQVPDLPARRMVPAEGRFMVWDATLDHGTTREDLERTSFWKHNTTRVKPFDEIRAICEDGSFVAYLIVQAIGPKDMKVHVREFVEMDKIDPNALAIPQGYKVDWGGRIAMWRARQGSDVLKEGFQTESEARRWLGSHLQVMNR